MTIFERFARHVALFACLFALVGCNTTTQPTNSANSATSSTRSNHVVIYCSVDDVYARPILRALEEKTGLTIRPLFDAEAAKTAGLAARIRAEKNNPRADVFWSSATLQTLLLSREGLLHSYTPPSASELPSKWRGKDWITTGVRARIFVHNAREKQPPRVLDDFLQGRFKGKIGVSNPLFGTGSDWIAAIATRRGRADALNYFRRLKQNGVQVLPGNSVVAERVARGELLAGVTDTDDFFALRQQFPTLQIGLPQNAVSPADLVFVPMTAAIVKGAPNQENAKKLMDALASPEVEALIVKNMPGVLPLRADWKDVPLVFSRLRRYIPHARDDIGQWANNWNTLRDPLAEILLRD